MWLHGSGCVAFTFAVVLGIVTDDISTQVDKVRVHS
jgi:sarcosine oxidase delta subunit